MARGSTRSSKQASADRPGVADPTAPLDGGELLTAARPVLSLLRTDLEERATDPGVTQALDARYENEKQRQLTGDSFAEWREARIAQIAASWFLSCVFVRTLEDRSLLGQARLAGPDAMDSQTMFFQLAPSLTERDYLLFVFRELAELPASRALFDREHALVWQLSPSAEAAKELLRLFRTPSAEMPAFRFGQASTRFLGDLYQDLYEDVRKRFALLQTPDFIESFILDRTLEPAIQRFGLGDTTVIDPACGSGHFLLGAFDRLFEYGLRQTPGIDARIAAQRALDAVFGADINPYAVAIARMRLVLAFLEKAGITKLKDAPAPNLHLVVADSLLHNPQRSQLALAHQEGQSAEDWHGQAFALEDEPAARDVLHRQYAAVVGNPPFIAVQDRALRDAYRATYRAASGKYTFSTVFVERFFQLARERGMVGLINSNAFLKRSFGQGLIEDVLPSQNLSLVVNTAWVPIPGPSIQTVMLFGSAEPPRGESVRCVLGTKAETPQPNNPGESKVWHSICLHFDELGYEDDFITVADISRTELSRHPWSLSGGGAAELKAWLEERSETTLEAQSESIGITSFTLEDEVFIRPSEAWAREHVPGKRLRPLVAGEAIRDWSLGPLSHVLFPYDDHFSPVVESALGISALAPWKAVLSQNKMFDGSAKAASGLRWYEFGRLSADKFRTPLAISHAEVASHNHFYLDMGGSIFGQTARVIKLKNGATEEEHYSLLAYLNSSTALFWLKQVAHQFGTATHDVYSEHGRPESNRFAFAASVVAALPLPRLESDKRAELAGLALRIQSLAMEWDINACARRFVEGVANGRDPDTRRLEDEWWHARLEMFALQEEIDWIVYEVFGIASRVSDGTDLRLDEGERPYCCSFDMPEPWASRRRQYADNRFLRLVEAASYKRQWSGRRGVFGHAASTLSLEVQRSILEFVLRAAEANIAQSTVVVSVGRLVSALERQDAVTRVLSIGGHWNDWDRRAMALINILGEEVEELPFLSSCYLSESGRALRREWNVVRRTQVVVDDDSLLSLRLPRKYSQKDYVDAKYWRARGSLDVPLERFISYPGCESDQDGEPVYGWAGWNHLQRAQALAALYQKRKTEEAWTTERLTPMLAGLLELLPWIQQWHNELDPEYGLRMGEYFAQFLDGELATLGLTKAHLEAWRPTKRANRSKVAAATGEALSGEGKASSLKRPRRARQQASEPPATASPESSGGDQPVRKYSSLPTWGSDILGEVAFRTGLGTKAGSWATSLRGESLGTAVLAAVLRQQTEPSRREQVERAVVLALLPRLMQPHFASASRWKSVIGKNDLGISSVKSLAIPWKAVIRSAILQKVLIEDSNGRWLAGPDIDDVPTSPLDARALVALSWIASAPAEDAAVTQEQEELRAVA